MTWNELDYPSSWKNLEKNTRRKAIDMGNRMLENGYDENEVISIVTRKIKEGTSDASYASKPKPEDFRQENITQRKNNEGNQSAKNSKNDVHFPHNNREKSWEENNKEAQQVSAPFETRKETVKHSKEISDRQNRYTDDTSHTKSQETSNENYNDRDVHVQYNDNKEHWEVKTKGAQQASATFETKKEAEERAREIADNRNQDTDVVSHTKNQETSNENYNDRDVHVQYNDNKEHWEVKTKGAQQVSATFETKKEAEERAREITDNRNQNADVVSHTKDENNI